jgi:hypothetical protein
MYLVTFYICNKQTQLPKHGELPDHGDLRFFYKRGVGKGGGKLKGRPVG